MECWRIDARARAGWHLGAAPHLGPPEATDVTLDDARCVDNARRVQDRLPRPAVRWGYPIMTMWRRSQHRFQFVPARVLTRRRRLSHSRSPGESDRRQAECMTPGIVRMPAAVHMLAVDHADGP